MLIFRLLIQKPQSYSPHQPLLLTCLDGYQTLPQWHLCWLQHPPSLSHTHLCAMGRFRVSSTWCEGLVCTGAHRVAEICAIQPSSVARRRISTSSRILATTSQLNATSIFETDCPVKQNPKFRSTREIHRHRFKCSWCPH